MHSEKSKKMEFPQSHETIIRPQFYKLTRGSFIGQITTPSRINHMYIFYNKDSNTLSDISHIFKTPFSKL